jgi:DNA-binding transcriptional LysR family regulator
MDLYGIDLNLLVAFDALMAERSVTRAGLRIGRTQPAMSAALSRLRLLLRDELFVRSSAGLQPTPRALELAAPLSAALADIGRLLDAQRAFDPARATLTFTLGLSDHPAMVVLPPLLRRLAEHAPDVRIKVRAFTAREDAITLLDAGEVDAAVGVPGAVTPRIPTLPLFMENFVCVMRRGHPLAKKSLTLERFLAQQHLLVSPEGDGVGLVDTLLSKIGRRRHVAVRVPQTYAAPAAVAATSLLATLMAGVVRASGLREQLTLKQPPPELALEPIPFVLHWHRRNDAHPAQRWLREQIVAACATLP